jgi:hypothetical protein
MSEDEMATIDANTTSALAAYRGARAAAWRSPSGDNVRVMEQQRERVDFFLDARIRRMTREELIAAYARPMRKLVSA